jgi:tRNA (cmo5U34)-methyltransferase
MLEKMAEFFDARLEGYEEHQLTCIDSAQEFYPYTAACLPQAPGTEILDLGCGTGLELEAYFAAVPAAKVTGVDLAPGMLTVLQQKFPEKDLTLIQGSYFNVPFGEDRFDAAVSVESLHHFTREEKIPLYAKLLKALKPEGFFILTDYFSLSDEEETVHRQELIRLKKEQGLPENEFYHYDTPLTVEHEKEALLAAGFSSVKVLKNWGATYTLKAKKKETIRGDRRKNGKNENLPGMTLWMCLGLAVGTAIGAATHNMGLWIPAGISAGLCFGMGMAQKKEKDSGEGTDRKE